jgi:2-keto-4-pentenoate hydratase
VEAEIAVVIGKDIAVGPRTPGRDEVADAVSAVIPSLEVADTRWSNYKEASAAAVFADLGYAGAWITGETVREWRSIDLARLKVTLSNKGVEIGSGTGMRGMGDPLLGLCAALADLGREGKGFKTGDIVSTGTCTVPHLASAGDSLVADFGVLGQVRVDFS